MSLSSSNIVVFLSASSTSECYYVVLGCRVTSCIVCYTLCLNWQKVWHKHSLLLLLFWLCSLFLSLAFCSLFFLAIFAEIYAHTKHLEIMRPAQERIEICHRLGAGRYSNQWKASPSVTSLSVIRKCSVLTFVKGNRKKTLALRFTLNVPVLR